MTALFTNETGQKLPSQLITMSLNVQSCWDKKHKYHKWVIVTDGNLCPESLLLPSLESLNPILYLLRTQINIVILPGSKYFILELSAFYFQCMTSKVAFSHIFISLLSQVEVFV